MKPLRLMCLSLWILSSAALPFLAGLVDLRTCLLISAGFSLGVATGVGLSVYLLLSGKETR